jgi:hypothetical protein
MRYAICNETFEGWDHARTCARISELGYTGLEIAPFTLAPLITDVTPQRRVELRKQAEAAGVKIVGLHWLLAKTDGFHLTSSDSSTRKRTGLYLAEYTSRSWLVPLPIWVGISSSLDRHCNGISLKGCQLSRLPVSHSIHFRTPYMPWNRARFSSVWSR